MKQEKPLPGHSALLKGPPELSILLHKTCYNGADQERNLELSLQRVQLDAGRSARPIGGASRREIKNGADQERNLELSSHAHSWRSSV